MLLEAVEKTREHTNTGNFVSAVTVAGTREGWRRDLRL